MQSIRQTDFQFEGQTAFYRGKVRDVYTFGDRIAVVTTDRISAFDVVLPSAVPLKGQILNGIAALFLRKTADIAPNWLQNVPHPNVSIGLRCEPFPVEMVIRGCLVGHAWREYRDGKRKICGLPMPDGMRENDRFPEPIISPTTKAEEGHDEDISAEDIVNQGLVSAEDYAVLEKYSRALFARGREIAAGRGLILADTKYEFGKKDGKIYLIDEIHTPDSSRYFYAEGFAARQEKGEAQKQLSKEFVRQWLISEGFQGKDGQKVPEMSDEKVREITERYLELYRLIAGRDFVEQTETGGAEAVEAAIRQSLGN